MPSILLSDNGVSSGSAGLKTTAASDGALALQTTTAGGTATTAVTIDTTQQIGIGTSSPADIVHISSASPRLTFTSTNNTSGARYNTVGTATSGSHRFQYNGTEVLTVGISGQTLALQGASPVSGTGISFPATQSASSDANTLDDYEEGTWSPQLTSDGGSVSGYTVQNGYYRKIGSQVTVWFSVSASTITGSTLVRLSNLPFSVGTTGTGYQPLTRNSTSTISLETYTGTGGQAFYDTTTTGYLTPANAVGKTLGGVYTYIAS